MRHAVLLACALASSPALSTEAAAPTTAAAPVVDASAVAMRVLDALDAGHYDEAAAPFSPQMRKAVGPDRLKQVWAGLPPAQTRGAPTVHTENGVTVVDVPIHREGVSMLARVAVDADGAVVGFLVQPLPTLGPAPAPPSDATYTERDLDVGKGETALHGTLALPKGRGPFPGVVLVHGSGPQDRDETIGGSRPFLDIARGLAERGIAVLRYEKRTHQRPGDFAGEQWTVDDEAVRDAVTAVSTLAGTPGVQRSHVFVLGHSLGAQLAPHIAMKSGRVAGAVLLASPARPILDLLPEQYGFLAALDGKVDDTEKAAIEQVKQQIAKARGDAPAEKAGLPLGLPQGYWKSVEAIDARADARTFGKPVLVLQGGRDFQVTASDWTLWTQAFADSRQVTLKHYPSLNHLGVSGAGSPNPSEYNTPGHVDNALIADIADWIQAH